MATVFNCLMTYHSEKDIIVIPSQFQQNDFQSTISDFYIFYIKFCTDIGKSKK